MLQYVYGYRIMKLHASKNGPTFTCEHGRGFLHYEHFHSLQLDQKLLALDIFWDHSKMAVQNLFPDVKVMIDYALWYLV